MALAAKRLARLCARLDGPEVVGIATGGSAALAQIEAPEPDVVLLDISIPGMDGIALARVLEARQRRPAIVFVAAGVTTPSRPSSLPWPITR